MNQVIVRRFEPADREACARIFERVQREVFADDDPVLYAARRFERSTRGEQIWIAAVGTQIAGFATLWRSPPFVHYLLVDQRWRGRGIGRALLDGMLANVTSPVDLKCRTGNLAAQRFYEQLGWIEVERAEDAGVPYVRYRLQPDAGRADGPRSAPRGRAAAFGGEA